ncbi:snurportin-1 isoform X2 [Populus alba x Populus x berolinensis]|uniref:Snurportin-1 n=1 Tax=Populus alba x Populus x berolinensis TaxID=444605 RepID=A0AAD6LP95_9ROSI|nr:snurportin-1 isoform X2 [Populus alba x Populus x berolinensis]
MAPPQDTRRPFKRLAISDQQRRRDISLQRQAQSRRDAQHQARCLASYSEESGAPSQDLDVRHAAKLKGAEARKWFAKQLMLHEWMIDVCVCKATGKRCFVVSTNGTTVSRQRNGSILHRFPSALPNGAKKRGTVLVLISLTLDQTYYVIDMVCWRGYSLYDCAAEFRFFWLNSKLGETGACDPPSFYHKYKFSTVPVYNCDQNGLFSAYQELCRMLRMDCCFITISEACTLSDRKYTTSISLEGSEL